MGLLAGDIPAEQTAYGVITYDGNSYNASATGEKWERINNKCTSVNWNASTTFSSTDKPYNDGSTLFYIAKPNDAITISASVGTQLYAWTVSDTDTTIGDENEYKTFTIPIPDYSNAFNKKVWEFAYAGGARTWVAPHTGTYTMECWGAKGGSVSSYTGASTLQGGGGAYTSGQISINKNDAFYVYVGQESDINVESATKTFNGGGGCYWYKGGGTFKEGRGGGATDIRIVYASAWVDASSLRSRIMVAAGGGGATNYGTTGSEKRGSGTGGAAGGLKGYSSSTTYTSSSNVSTVVEATGGSQDSRGLGWKINNTYSYSGHGAFGYGGTGTNGYPGFNAGGGGGWYGGGSGGVTGGIVSSAAGGSSFISGHPGCNAVNPSTGAHLGASTTMTINSKEYIFDHTVMIDGQGKEWTTANQTSGGTTVGVPAKPASTGNGYCVISYQNQ